MTGLSAIEEKLISVRKKQVLLDRDVAFLYGVETKRINEAVKNNPEKFPEGYVMILDKSEEQILRSKFSTLEKSSSGQHSKYGVKAFTPEFDY
jgi:hypothetical protein